MTEQDWDEEFAKYRTSPEFKRVNSRMTVEARSGPFLRRRRRAHARLRWRAPPPYVPLPERHRRRSSRRFSGGSTCTVCGAATSASSLPSRWASSSPRDTCARRSCAASASSSLPAAARGSWCAALAPETRGAAPHSRLRILSVCKSLHVSPASLVQRWRQRTRLEKEERR